MEPRVHAVADMKQPEEETLEFALRAWGKDRPVLVAGGYTTELAVEAVGKTYKEYDVIVVFGRRFISTPGLLYHVRKGIEWIPYDRTTLSTVEKGDSMEKGNTDYPFSKDFIAKCKSGDQAAQSGSL